MVLSKRVGTILKEARETKRLTIRDVAQETNMIPRYIQALESEDYTVFPGETYALGFLRAYSDYLQLDTEHLINLYRGLQIDQSQTPLKELTKPTSPFPMINSSYLLPIGAGIVVVSVVMMFITGIISLPDWDFGGAPAVANCKDRELREITIPQSGLPPRIEDLSGKDSLKFVQNSMALKFCLREVLREEGQPPVGVFALRINEEENFEFRAQVKETYILSKEIDELSGLNSKIKLTPVVLADYSARIQLEYVAETAPDTPPPVAVDNANGSEDNADKGATEIRITLKFIDDSYIEWEVDGKLHRGKISAGKTRILEAKNRLIIKLGNAGGVRVGTGTNLKVAGPVSKIVKLMYIRVPDPLDSSKFRIQVKREVVR